MATLLLVASCSPGCPARALRPVSGLLVRAPCGPRSGLGNQAGCTTSAGQGGSCSRTGTPPLPWPPGVPRPGPRSPPQTSLHVWSGRCRSQRPWWQVTRHRDTGGLRWRGWQLVGRLFVKGRWCLLVAARQWPGCPCPSHCPHHSRKDGSTWVTGGPGSGPGTPHSGPHSILLPAPLCSVRGLRQWAAGRRPWPSLGGWRPSLCAWLL